MSRSTMDEAFGEGIRNNAHTSINHRPVSLSSAQYMESHCVLCKDLSNLSSSDSNKPSDTGPIFTITIDDSNINFLENEHKSDEKKCTYIRKLWGNCFLPIFGIDGYRFYDKIPWKHSTSQQLISNTMSYCSRIYVYVKLQLLEEMDRLAKEIRLSSRSEAGDLSKMSAEVWTATYLLLSTHKKMREADFNDVRTAYGNLAWDSGFLFRKARELYETLQEFQSMLLPLWNEVEAEAGLSWTSRVELKSESISKRSKKSKKSGETVFPKVLLHDDLVLQNTLKLVVTPIPKDEGPNEPKNNESGKPQKMIFGDMDYGSQLQIIKDMFEDSLKVVQKAPGTLLKNGEKLTSQVGDSSDSGEEPELTCSRNMQILKATLKVLFEQVDLPSEARYNIVEWIRCLSDELQSYLEEACWVVHKFSEFHSLLRLCYNFALLCFDLDLPPFKAVMQKEEETDAVYGLNNGCDDRLDYRTVSLTQLMSEASLPDIRNKEFGIDDDFDWQNFYKTDYHLVSQRVPMRLGCNLLQFRIKPDVKITVRGPVEIIHPKVRNDVLSAPDNPWKVQRTPFTV